MYRLASLIFVLMMFGAVSCRSLNRQGRSASPGLARVVQVAAENRQLGSGLFTFGTLVSPLLFLMGMGSFVSMLPQMFQTVMQGVGPNLAQIFNPQTAAAAGGGSSTRLRRDTASQSILTDDLLDEIERRLNLAVLKNERPIN